MAVDAASAPLTMALLRLLMADWIPFDEVPAAFLAETAQITADTLAMSALMTALTDVMSVLMTADTEVTSAFITVESAVLAEAALEAAFESAGLDVAVEALNAAEI